MNNQTVVSTTSLASHRFPSGRELLLWVVEYTFKDGFGLFEQAQDNGNNPMGAGSQIAKIERSGRYRCHAVPT